MKLEMLIKKSKYQPHLSLSPINPSLTLPPPLTSPFRPKEENKFSLPASAAQHTPLQKQSPDTTEATSLALQSHIPQQQPPVSRIFIKESSPNPDLRESIKSLTQEKDDKIKELEEEKEALQKTVEELQHKVSQMEEAKEEQEEKDEDEGSQEGSGKEESVVVVTEIYESEHEGDDEGDDEQAEEEKSDDG